MCFKEIRHAVSLDLCLLSNVKSSKIVLRALFYTEANYLAILEEDGICEGIWRDDAAGIELGR